jgi:hypothetical protein
MRTFNEWALERYEEGFFDSLKKGYGQGYQQARQGVEQNYDRYADAAKQALSRAGGAAKALSQKTGVPLPLATALVAAGITGGPAAVPFAALLYFVKQPLMKGANKAFDATWDAGAKVAGKVGQAMAPQPKPALESFRAFVEADTWGDWAGEKIGGAAGRVAGNVAGYGGKIAGALGQRAKEIGEWAKGNPKEVARMLFLVGAGAAIGAGVGKITHEVKDFIMEKIKDQGIDPQVLSWVKQNIVLDDNGKSASGDRITSKGGQEVNHPYFINDDGHKVYGDQSVSMADKLLKNKGASSGLDPKDLHAQGSGIGRTINASSTGGSESLTRVGVPSSPDLRDTYRDAARVLQGEYKPGVLGGVFGGDADRSDATNAMLQSSPTPLSARLDLTHYGHSGSAEIAKRLAAAKAQFSPDKYTVPAAVAGGVVGATGQKRNGR